MTRKTWARALVLGLTILGCGSAWAQASAGTAAPVVLKATEAGKLLPDAVYFSGQSATIQARNSGGVRFSDGKYTLVMLVDSSGYSSSLQQKYQGYLIAEDPLLVGGKRLAAGAYGVGFVGDHFLVMDIGAHDILETAATHDAEIHRPTPLQIDKGEKAGEYRLYFGRNYVTLRQASR